MTTTDSQSELLTEVNSKNEIIGPLARGIAHSCPDKIYRTIYVIVRDKNNKILLQKRSSTKDLYPDCWDLSVGGHVNYGRSYLETAIKELEEEIGIKASAKELKFIGEVLVKLPSSNEFFQVFEYNLKVKDDIKVEVSELSQTAWMTMEEIRESMNQKTLKWYPRPLQVVELLYSSG